MTLEDLKQKYEEMSDIQLLATEFMNKCKQSNKWIEYEGYTASVYLDAINYEELKLINKLKRQQKTKCKIHIYPHGNQLEMWFF